MFEEIVKGPRLLEAVVGWCSAQNLEMARRSSKAKMSPFSVITCHGSASSERQEAKTLEKSAASEINPQLLSGLVFFMARRVLKSEVSPLAQADADGCLS